MMECTWKQKKRAMLRHHGEGLKFHEKVSKVLLRGRKLSKNEKVEK